MPKLPKVILEEGQWVLYYYDGHPQYGQLVKRPGCWGKPTDPEDINAVFGPPKHAWVDFGGYYDDLKPENVIRVFPKATFPPETILAKKIEPHVQGQ